MIDVLNCTVTVMVEHLDRSRAFYTDTLGFRELYRGGDHFCMLDRGGFLLGLHTRSAAVRPSGPAPSNVSIGLQVPDLKGAMRALEDAGVTFPAGIAEDGGGVTRADFRDLDETPLYLIQTGHGQDD